MTVSLTFTIDEEDFHPELSKLLGHRGPDLQVMVDLFQAIKRDLENTEDDEVDAAALMEKIGKFRRALLKVDVRLHEMTRWLEGYAASAETEEAAAESPEE